MVHLCSKHIRLPLTCFPSCLFWLFLSVLFHITSTQCSTFKSVERVYFALNDQGFCTPQAPLYNLLGNAYCQSNTSTVPTTSSYWQCDQNGMPTYYNCQSQDCTQSTCRSQKLPQPDASEACRKLFIPLTRCSSIDPNEASNNTFDNKIELQTAATNISSIDTHLQTSSQLRTIKVDAPHLNSKTFKIAKNESNNNTKASNLSVDIFIHRANDSQIALVSYSIPKKSNRMILSADPVKFNLSNSILKALNKDKLNVGNLSNGPINIASIPDNSQPKKSGAISLQTNWPFLSKMITMVLISYIL